MNADLFGMTPPPVAFKDIRNQRPSVAEEKARLALRLNRLCKSPPRSLNSASINAVREWKAAHAAALKILEAKRSSVIDLGVAIKSMERFT